MKKIAFYIYILVSFSIAADGQQQKGWVKQGQPQQAQPQGTLCPGFAVTECSGASREGCLWDRMFRYTTSGINLPRNSLYVTFQDGSPCFQQLGQRACAATSDPVGRLRCRWFHAWDGFERGVII